VTITGFIPNSRLPLYQAAADALAMPYGKKISGSSGGDISRVINPMKMFDYMAAGRPIIASDIPVFHEVLDEKFVVFCESENPESWTNALRSLQLDPARRELMGFIARENAQKYTWKNRAIETVSKLEKLLE
jgi:glycosyltransferase involved in cell wall biosynthesis